MLDNLLLFLESVRNRVDENHHPLPVENDGPVEVQVYLGIEHSGVHRQQVEHPAADRALAQPVEVFPQARRQVVEVPAVKSTGQLHPYIGPAWKQI